jgi:hypothetical protein
MSNQRSYDFLNQLTDHRIPGGCDDCAAYQTLDRYGPGVYVLTVHHDHACPFLSEHRSNQR